MPVVGAVHCIINGHCELGLSASSRHYLGLPRRHERNHVIQKHLQNILWYLKRPKLYWELGQHIFHARISNRRKQEKRDEDRVCGREWCAQHKREESSFLDALDLNPKLILFSEIHPEFWKAANTAVDSCPVEMGGPGNVNLLYHLVRNLPALRVVETGVASGWSSLAVLAAMDDLGRGKLASIDMPYHKRNNDPWVGCAVPDSLRRRWMLHRLPDREGLPKALRQLRTLDLAHHDSDKSYEGRMYVYEACWPALRTGGVLLSDDIEDNFAFRHFAERVSRTRYVFLKKPGSYCGGLIK